MHFVWDLETQSRRAGRAEEVQVQVQAHAHQGELQISDDGESYHSAWDPPLPAQDRDNVAAASLPPSKSGANFALWPILTWNHVAGNSGKRSSISAPLTQYMPLGIQA